ncbi:AP-1 accessory protein LAA1 [Cyberlindnera fabianii]|uniref:AP-1 accessory protein LAA1 n=1 Tax=Cyberlindnera fabianii TaxID=36022 RepID=A0A1V2L330_CYBFA|nr:AP-1 accessory protein LAA1 [Cyberlindnera fabianii]
MTGSSSVLAQLPGSSNRAHLLLHWHVELHALIARVPTIDVSAHLKEIEEQINFFHDDKNKEFLDALSQTVCSAIAKNYAALITRSRAGLFDTTNKHVATFTDSKKPQQLRSLSCVVLTALYMSFGYEIVSSIPVLLTTALKAMKKDKNTLQLAQLWYALIRNGGREELNDSLVTKFNKLLKSIDNTEALAALHGSLGGIMSYKSTDIVSFKASHQSIIHNGLRSHMIVRVATAKSIAEACVHLQWSPQTTLELYKDLYLDSNQPAEQIGLLESIVHYTYLSILHDEDFVINNIEVIVFTLLGIYSHERFHAFSLNRKYRTVNHLLYVFRTALALIGESSQANFLEHILMPQIEKNQGLWKITTLLKLAAIIISNASSLSDTRVEKYRITLWKLCLSSDYELQSNAVVVLKEVALKSPSIIKELLETSLHEVVNNGKQQASDKIAIKSHGLALIISNLVCLADKDYVPEILIQEIWDSFTATIKDNKTVSDQNKNNLIVSWIALCGVFTYKDQIYIESLSDEFMTIWDAMDFTSSISTSPISTLEVISHALTAALCYLHTTSSITEVSKFFVESLNKLKTLSCTVKSSPATDSSLSLIKKRCLQIYLVCIDFVKSDNSSVLIQTISNFSDLPDYQVLIKNEAVTPWSKDDGFNNGTSSMLTGQMTDELYIKFKEVQYQDFQAEYSIDRVPVPVGSISSGNVKSWLSEGTWIDELESTLLCAVSTTLEYDFAQPSLGQYSLKNVYSPPVKTAIIDASMEIFITSFSSVSTKIQLSLLETLRTNLLSKSTSASTKIAQAINTSIVLHGALLVTHKDNAQLDVQVGNVLLETLRTLYSTYPSTELLVMNSESIGLVISLCALKEQIPIFIKKIVDDLSSGSRSFNAMILSYIYQYNSSHFSDIMPVLLKLAQDPHPTVHAWSMDSLATIIDKHVAMSTTTAIQVIQIIESCYLDDRYGRFTGSNYSNLNCDADSNTVLAKVLRSVVTSVGPAIKGFDNSTRESVRSMIYGLLWLENNVNSRIEMVKLIQELMIYDLPMVQSLNIVKILKYLIQNNIGRFIGSELMLSLYEERNEPFPMTSSNKLLDLSLDFLSQLVKTSEDKSFISEVEPLVWLSLENEPDSDILNSLVSQWLDATYDLSWFIKLQKLFNASKQQLYFTITRSYKKILEKHTHKKVVVDVKDEEAQSITNKNEEEVKGEAVNWRFKARILELIKQLLSYTHIDTKLYADLGARVSDLIKISFAASTSSAEQLRLLGIRLLGDIISLYASAKDPIYPTMSLLEQQQAQITSALVPAFQHDSSPLLVAEAIKVVAMFVGSGVVKVSKLGRTAKMLTGALEDLTGEDQDEFKVSDVVITSDVGQRRVKLAILNAWAELKSLNDGQNEELDALVDQHLDLLLPLWISALKEFALIRHGNSKNDELFNDCWVNLMDAIGCITENDVSSIQGLLKNDALGFFYMLYSHCIFSLTKNEQRVKILNVFVKILAFKELIKLIYYDEIFHESLEVLERLVVTGAVEERSILLDITQRMFVNYFEVNHEDEFGQNADKLFEILRLNLQSITQLIPNDNEIVNHEITPAELQLAKKGLGSVTKMISYFPDMIKLDLFASVLSVVAKVYASSKSEQLVPLVLPTVKEITHDLVLMGDFTITNNFYRTIKPHLTSPTITVISTSILLSTAPKTLRLTTSDIDLIVSSIMKALDSPEGAQLATQSIKSITVAGTTTSDVLLCRLIPRFVSEALNHDDSRLFVELLILVLKSHKCVELYKIIMPTLLEVWDRREQMGEYLHKRMASLINISPECFKAALGVLDDEQRAKTEKLVKLGEAVTIQKHVEGDEIKLKTFE